MFRNVLPDGTRLFIELAFAADRLLISAETPSLHALAPQSVRGTPGCLPFSECQPSNLGM